MTKKIKVAIIGSGIVGATIAYELSKNPQLEITLIDQNTAPAQESTGAALGVLMAIMSNKRKGRAWQLRKTSIECYNDLIIELENLTKIKIPCNRQGILTLYNGEEETTRWQKLSEDRAKEGYKLEIWSKQKIQTKCPHVNVNDISGGVYSPQDLQVNPVILTKALVTGASLRGVNCIFGQKVDNFVIRPQNSSKNLYCYEIQTKDSKFDTDWVIITSGLGSTNLLKSLQQNIIINPVLGQALLLKSEQTYGNLDFQPVITNNDVYLVPIGNNEYWVGATVEFPDEKGYSLPEDKELLAKIHQEAIAFCPELKSASVIQSWSGERPRPEELSAPVITKISGYDNIILATGHYRNGILLAPATAKIVKQLISIKLY